MITVLCTITSRNIVEIQPKFLEHHQQMEKTSPMENTGTNNNLYMPYSMDNFTKNSIHSPIGSSLPVFDEKLSSNQMQPGNILRYFPNVHHVPQLSTSENQVPHHSKEIYPYFSDANYQILSASSVHTRSQPSKSAMFNGNPSLPDNAASLYPQYLHTFNAEKYLASSNQSVGHNHIVVTSQTSAAMSPMLQSYSQKVKLPPTEVTRNLPVSSSQQKWGQSNSVSSRLLKRELPVNTPPHYTTLAKDQTIFINPSISSGYSATHAYNVIDKSWQTSYTKSNPLNCRPNCTPYSSSYKALKQPAFQNTPTIQPSLSHKATMPSVSERSLPQTTVTLSSSLNRHPADANTVDTSLTQTNISTSTVSGVVSQSKVITSTTYNHHKQACDMSSQIQGVNSKHRPTPYVTRADDGKSSHRLRKKCRRRASSFDASLPKLRVDTKRRHR